eukprot:gene17450-19885_t
MFEVAAQAMDADKQRKKSTSLNALSPEEEAKQRLKAEESKANLYDRDVGSPLVRLMYDFFTDPYSSWTALAWAQLTAWIAVVRVLEIAFESCDGPNQYVGRPVDRSRYYFFLTDDQYFKVYVACMVPLIIDAVGRGIMAGFLVFASENNALLAELKEDSLQVFMLFADIVGVIPFLVTAIYTRPYDVPSDQLQNVILTLIELLITARILRLIKDLPAIRSIRIALINSVDHLVLPVFFFFTFNITSGVFLYFVEPCFNVNTCPWQDQFESSFFSIVTMTTTGYGNQIPSYEFGRFVACAVMLFGALFLSMPLAIIGNEYSSAWTMICEEEEAKKKAKEQEKVAATAGLLTHTRMQGELNAVSSDDLGSRSGSARDKTHPLHAHAQSGAFAQGGTHSLVPQTDSSFDAADPSADVNAEFEQEAHIAALAAAEEERKKKEFEAEKNIVVSDPVIATQKTLFEVTSILSQACKEADFISPGMLLQYCELQATIPAFLTSLRNEIAYLLRERHRQMAGLESLITATAEAEAKSAGKRRLSVFGGKTDTHSAAAVARNQQLVAIHELENEDDLSMKSNAKRGYSNAPSPLNSPLSSPLLVTSRKRSEARAPEHLNTNNTKNPNTTNTSGLSPLARHRKVAPDNTAPATEDNSVSQNNSEKNSEKLTTENSNPTLSASGKRISLTANAFSRTVQPIQPVVTRNRNNTMSFDSNGDGDPTSPRDRFDSASSDGGTLRRSLASRATMFRLPMVTMRARETMYNKLKSAIGESGIEELRARTSSSVEFDRQVRILSQNPKSLRNRLWILLEIPNSSREAKIVQIVLIFLISFSIFILYTQTITNLTLYGESSEICGSVLTLYCSDKDNTQDPGCFVQYANGTTSDMKMQYNCEEDTCFKYGNNFGSLNTSMSCYNTTVPPFQDLETLEGRYGKPYLFTSRAQMHLLSPICTRIECIDNSNSYTDTRVLWLLAEFVTNITFTIELILRIFVAESLMHYARDKMNFLDVMSIIPFYVELFRTLLFQGFDKLSFSILASSPAPIFFVTMRAMKIFRMFKLTRDFNASKVIKETAQRAYKQILGMISFLAFMVILFAILLYQVEGGRACFVGDSDCHPPPDAFGLQTGDKIYINKDGELTQFGNVFFGLWYSFVTLTTTGYGDIVAVTNAGQVMTIILMLVGQFYMAMPLTAAASTFYSVHEIYNAKRAKISDERNKAEAGKTGNKDDMGNIIAVTAGAAAVVAGNTTVLNAPPPAADAPVVIYGDYLDRKLQKRVQNLIGEIALLQTSIVEFYTDLHKTSSDYNNDDAIAQQGNQRAGFVEINNRKIP